MTARIWHRILGIGEGQIRDRVQRSDGRATMRLSTAGLSMAAGVVFAVSSNWSFLTGVLAKRDPLAIDTWLFGLAMLLLLVSLHTALLSVVLVRPLARIQVGVLIVVSAVASHFMDVFGVYLDPTMVRNALKTDLPEAAELITWGLVPHLLLSALIPLLLLSRIRVVDPSVAQALLQRALTFIGALIVGFGSMLLVFQDFSALMRNQKELRYLITPANIVYSSVRTLIDSGAEAQAGRTPAGVDATLDPIWTGRKKPVLLIVMVGETARAANWGLSGYQRDTTPELSRLGVLNFADVESCGTNTETSLPCMFSTIGRRDYSERRIRTTESVLHILSRAGFDVSWRDNQSGCKGVCEGLSQEQIAPSKSNRLCDGSRCFDEVLLDGLDDRVKNSRSNFVVTLHMLGNHGPAYFKRYPKEFRAFTPTCDTAELQNCSREEIINAYDNALRYTDHVVARAVRWLNAQSDRFDTALVYVSDHGESLGEKGLYLHGVPYAIAPDEQTKIPMVWWVSEGFRESFRLDGTCLAAQAAKAWTHDNFAHSLLGLLRVGTKDYDSQMDITLPCR